MFLFSVIFLSCFTTRLTSLSHVSDIKVSVNWKHIMINKQKLFISILLSPIYNQFILHYLSPISPSILSIHPSILSIDLSDHSSMQFVFNLSIHSSIQLSTHPYSISNHPSVHPSVNPFTYPFIHPSIYLIIRLCINPSLFYYINVSVYWKHNDK